MNNNGHLPPRPSNLKPQVNNSGGTTLKIPVTPKPNRHAATAPGTAGGKK